MASSWFTNFSTLLIHSYVPEIILAFLFAYLYHHITTRKPPATPTNWPVLGMFPGLAVNIGNFHEWVTNLLRASPYTFDFRGPWFLGMDFLMTCDPANVNHVFNANFANYPKGEEFTEMFDILGNGIFNADGESWKIQRKMAHAVMSGPGFREYVVKCTSHKVDNGLVPLMSKLARNGDVVDLQDVFLRMTFDMTFNLVFGVDPGCLSEGFPIIPFAKAMDDAMEAIFFRHLVPSSFWKVMRRLNVGTERKLVEAKEVIDQFVAENIMTRRKEGQNCNNNDLLFCYIEQDGESNDKFLKETALSLMLAGRDTTGVALSWFFWLLAKNPVVKSKILDELKTKKEDLVYLHAALCETLRLYPSVPFEHKAPIQAEGLPSGNIAIPKQKIFFPIYALGRMEGIWGEDCLEFKPERWISERGRVRHEPAYKFLSFNCGPRICLGKEVAFTQMKAVAAAMISNFDVELVEGHVVKPKPSVILHMKSGLKVRVKQRSN